jgi:hypothetical protein
VAVDPLTQAWETYRGSVLRLYEVAGPALDERRELSDAEIGRAARALEEAAAASQSLTDIGRALLEQTEDQDYDRVATRLLAAASVDVAVACEILQLAPERPEPDPLFDTEEPSPDESPLALLEQADGLFGGAATASGAEADPLRAELRDATLADLAKLVDDASDPAWKFATGVVTASVAGIHFPPHADPVKALGELSGKLRRIKRHIVKLLISGLEKLVGVSGKTARHLVSESERFVDRRVGDAVQRARQRLFAGLIGSIVGREAAEASIDTLIARPHDVYPPDAANVRFELEALTGAYADEMEWTGRIAKWISIGAPFISTLAVHIGGPLIVAGIDGIGAGFVVYTLDVRVGTHRLPAKVRSVVKIVEDGLEHLL